ncbi:apolipoprotein N-acyltransferase [Tepiditoga spiralis]|uniref:Apolipoprotein N-acyltransferase n=1 Tax=Tepiditoga spiralis TaxID=2108365 RepID=A0A7G1G9V4_9BACT|nr:apolipoprotein N-acyltransferase [Tepiditoga spiralis]BBE30119.1 apolipoprotein N-acyltransferase [Tepiditoga spiralis]
MAYLLTLISGILTGLAMPGNLFSFFIWGSVVFYLKNMSESTKTYQRLLHTIIYSNSLLATTLWWQMPVLTKNIPEVLNHYPPIFGFLGFIGEIFLLSLPYLLIWILSELYHRKYRKVNYISLMFFYAFSYTAAEALREMGDLAVTGGSLGYALYNHIGLLQIASIFGYLGLTFIIILVNSAIAFDDSRDKIIKGILIFSAIYAINFSIERFIPITENSKTFKITAIQTNVPQEIKYNANTWKSYTLFSDLLQRAKDEKSSLIILPESTFMEDIQDTNVSEALKINIKTIKKPVLMGYPKKTETDYYNTAWLYDKEGQIKETYDKIKLTPFAEFLPYEAIFNKFKIFKLFVFYTPGSEFKTFNVNNTKFGVQICFETYFPEVSIQETKKGAEFLTAITNDGWFNTQTALIQHFTQSIFRAVETRRDFLQVSNTGITAMVDKYGRIKKVYSEHKEVIDTVSVNLNKKTSIYSNISGVFKALLFIGALILSIV